MPTAAPVSNPLSAEALLRRERFRDALRLLESAPPDAAREPETLALKAQALAGLAEFDQAATLAREAVTLDAGSARAHYALGLVAGAADRKQEAVDHFSRAVAADSSFAPALHALGLLMWEAGHREVAANALRRALAEDPDNWRYAAGVALLQPASRRAIDLRAAYLRGLREHPGSVRLRLRLLGTYPAAALAPLLGDTITVDPHLGFEAYQRILARPVLITYLLLAANVLMFAFVQTHGGADNSATLYRYGAKDTAAIVHLGQWWRLITPVFLHAGITHLAVNGMSLYFVGVLYERCVGQARFLYVYLLAGAGGSIASMALSTSLSVGASGAIFGIFGALGVYFFRNRALFGAVSGRLVKQVAIISAINLALPLAVPDIDGWAHLGGLLCGIVAAYLAGPWLPDPVPGTTVDAALSERRPLQSLLPVLLLFALVLVGLAALVIRWNPAGA